MKRLTGLILASMAMVLSGAAFTAVLWVTATSQGSRWLLTSLIPLGGINISVQKIEGRVLDRLLLTNVQITLAQQKLEINTLELRWKPFLLLSGTVAVQELNISGVQIQDDTPPDTKPPNLTWPKLPESA